MELPSSETPHRDGMGHRSPLTKVNSAQRRKYKHRGHSSGQVATNVQMVDASLPARASRAFLHLSMRCLVLVLSCLCVVWCVSHERNALTSCANSPPPTLSVEKGIPHGTGKASVAQTHGVKAQATTVPGMTS